MKRLFIVGLPKSIDSRIKDLARANNLFIDSIIADLDNSGKLKLVPFESDAIYAVSTYIDSLGNDYISGNVLALPYAPISPSVEDELTVLSEMGGKVTYIKGGADGWPRLGGAPDQGFLDRLVDSLKTEYFPQKALTPSEYFALKSAEFPNLLITSGSLSACDNVAPHRRKFIKKCADAFANYLSLNGKINSTIDTFFRKHELDHAQTGGINTRLCLRRDTCIVYDETRNTHLKEGDRTSRQAAARVYFHALDFESISYVGLIYAGPHPENDISKTHILK